MHDAQLVTPEPIVRAAFERVFSRIEADRATVEALYADYLPAHLQGDTRAEIAAVRRHLPWSAWRWLDLDEWRRAFAELGRYPVMWSALTAALDGQTTRAPSGLAEAAALLSVERLKQFLRDNGAMPKPAPKTRADWEAAVVASGKQAEMAALIGARQAERLEAWRHKEQEAVYALLAHTLTMTAYALRDDGQRQRAAPSMYQWTLIALPVPGCDIELDFCRRWNRGEIQGLPPFFPGDRSRLSERREHELERFAHLF